jgi:hypothetical protein
MNINHFSKCTNIIISQNVLPSWHLHWYKKILYSYQKACHHRHLYLSTSFNTCILKTRCVNATNAPALSQSFKAMFNLFQFQGRYLSKIIRPQFQRNESYRKETENLIFFCNFKRDNFVKINDHNQIRTWPAHSYDISTRAISTLYMYPNKS